MIAEASDRGARGLRNWLMQPQPLNKGDILLFLSSHALLYIVWREKVLKGDVTLKSQIFNTNPLR